MKDSAEEGSGWIPWHIVVSVPLALAILGISACSLWLVFSAWQYTTDISGQYTVTQRIELAKTLAQWVLGTSILGTLYVAWRRAKAAEQTAMAAQRTIEVAQEGQITERYTRAIEQLGNDNIAIRLGGIYALERIARDSDKDHWQVMEVLTAYVRENSPSDWHLGRVRPLQLIPGDIGAILVVLGRRNTERETPSHRLNLRMTDLRGAELEKADLRRADLRFADLHNVYLKDADLRDVNIFQANLEDAVLDGADFRGVNLRVVWNLTQEQFLSAISDESTKLPDYLIGDQSP